MNILIVGAGLTGAVMAERWASAGSKVTVIDKRDHIAGNCYDYVDGGVTMHKYGAHIFHTNNKVVWDYLSRFTEWRPYIHSVLANIQGNLIPIPFNFNSIQMLFPHTLATRLEAKLLANYKYGSKVSIKDLGEHSDEDLKFLSEFIYENVFKYYTMKQWGISVDDIDPAVLARVPVNISRDDRYFSDKYQGIPLKGYTAMVGNILSHKNITVELNRQYKKADADQFDKIYYTGTIDEYFDYRFGELSYRSLEFAFRDVNESAYQPVPVVNYPNNYDFTRIIECRHFLNETPTTNKIIFEYPAIYKVGKNEPMYPISNPNTQALYAKYAALSDGKAIFAGRLGAFKYLDMDKIVELALALEV